MRVVIVGVVVLMGSTLALAQNLPWNNPGGAQGPAVAAGGPGGPAPTRDISGIWDAGGAGIGARGMQTAPLTAWGEAQGKTHHSGDGARMVPADQINDPLSTLADPGGFPRNLLFELRPFEVVQMPNKVLMLYMFEKRWRVIWTDGRQLPANPDPRWYGYSVGHWEDDSTFVVNSNGTDSGHGWITQVTPTATNSRSKSDISGSTATPWNSRSSSTIRRRTRARGRRGTS